MAVQAGLGRPGRQRRLPARNITAADVSCSAPQGAALRLGPQLQGGRVPTTSAAAVPVTCKLSVLCTGSLQQVEVESYHGTSAQLWQRSAAGAKYATRLQQCSNQQPDIITHGRPSHAQAASPA